MVLMVTATVLVTGNSIRKIRATRVRHSLQEDYHQHVKQGRRRVKVDQAVVERIDAIWDTLGLPGDKRSIWK